jgi:hypothetical protein
VLVKRRKSSASGVEIPDLSSRPITFGPLSPGKSASEAPIQTKRGRPSGPTVRAINALERIAAALEAIAGIRSPVTIGEPESDFVGYSDDTDFALEELRDLDSLASGRRAPKTPEEAAWAAAARAGVNA